MANVLFAQGLNKSAHMSSEINVSNKLHFVRPELTLFCASLDITFIPFFLCWQKMAISCKFHEKVLSSSRLIFQVLLFAIFSVLFALPAIQTYQKREVLYFCQLLLSFTIIIIIIITTMRHYSPHLSQYFICATAQSSHSSYKSRNNCHMKRS